MNEILDELEKDYNETHDIPLFREVIEEEE